MFILFYKINCTPVKHAAAPITQVFVEILGNRDHFRNTEKIEFHLHVEFRSVCWCMAILRASTMVRDFTRNVRDLLLVWKSLHSSGILFTVIGA